MQGYGPESDDKVLIADSWNGGGYDWATFALFMDAAGRLYVASDSGCSCNSAWDHLPDYNPVASVQEAISLVRNWTNDDSEVEKFTREALEATKK